MYCKPEQAGARASGIGWSLDRVLDHAFICSHEPLSKTNPQQVSSVLSQCKVWLRARRATTASSHSLRDKYLCTNLNNALFCNYKVSLGSAKRKKKETEVKWMPQPRDGPLGCHRESLEVTLTVRRGVECRRRQTSPSALRSSQNMRTSCWLVLQANSKYAVALQIRIQHQLKKYGGKTVYIINYIYIFWKGLLWWSNGLTMLLLVWLLKFTKSTSSLW